MPTRIKSAAEYRERAKKLRLAARTVRCAEMRQQLLIIAEDYEGLADSAVLISQHYADGATLGRDGTDG